MGYYMGDYYRGDYYRGDPGFLSFFKGVGKLIGRVAGIGGGTRAVQTLPEVIRPAGGIIRRAGPIMRRIGGVVARHPVLSAAGAAGAVGAMAGAGVEAMGGAAPMRGFHISKRTGALVRNRRMRVTNPRALRRAIRRATGFARLARRVLHFTSPRAPRGRAIFKRKQKKRI